MNSSVIKDLTYYESLPYTITLRKDDEGDFVARIQELSGCIAHGATEAEAIESVRSMQRLWIEDALECGDVIPEPEIHADLPSGKWLQRVPRKLHRDLVRLAQQENVSLNQLVTSMLSEQFALKSCVQAVRTCVADAFLAAGSARRNVARWALRDDESLQWEYAVPFLPQGGITQALSRVEKLALPWSGHKHTWLGEKSVNDAFFEDYFDDHASRADR
jgi:predicted RNase H-like HicB family nuclease